MRINHIALPLFNALTEAVRSVGKQLQEFVTDPNVRVPEGLAEAESVCATMGMSSYQRYLRGCRELAEHLRHQPRTDGYRELATALGGIGIHLRSLADGASPSFSTLNKAYERLSSGALDDAMRASYVNRRRWAMFRTIEVENEWSPPADASEVRFLEYLRAHMDGLETYDVAALVRFFQGLEPRNTHPSVKVFIDAAICLLGSDSIDEQVAQAIAECLISLRDGGYQGFDVEPLSVLLCAAQSLVSDNARLSALRKFVLTDTIGAPVDAALIGEFIGAMDRFKEIVRQGSDVNDFTNANRAAGELAKHAHKLNNEVVATLAAALVQGTSSQLKREATLRLSDSDAWVYVAMATLVMHQSLEMSRKGFDLSNLAGISHAIATRLAMPQIPFASPFPDSGAIDAAALRAALAHLSREAGLELDRAKQAIEAGVNALERGAEPSQVAASSGAALAGLLSRVSMVLEAIGSPRTSALAAMAAKSAAMDTTWAGVIGVQMLTDITSVISIGFERMASSNTHQVDELVIHEIAGIAPELLVGDSQSAGDDGEVTDQILQTLRRANASGVSIFVEEMSFYIDEAQLALGVVSDRGSIAAGEPAWAPIVSRLFHTLRGSSAVAGLTPMIERAKAIEDGLDRWIEWVRSAADSVDFFDEFERARQAASMGIAELRTVMRGLASHELMADALTSHAESISRAFAYFDPLPLKDDGQDSSPVADAPEGEACAVARDDSLVEQVFAFSEHAPLSGEQLDPPSEEQVQQLVSDTPTIHSPALELAFSAAACDEGLGLDPREADDMLSFFDESATANASFTGQHGEATHAEVNIDELSRSIDLHAAAAKDDLAKLQDESLRAVLSDEVEGLFPNLNEAISRWRSESATASDIANARRLIHTIKGCVRIGGMFVAGTILHHLEDFLDSVEGQEDAICADTDLAALFARHVARCEKLVTNHLLDAATAFFADPDQAAGLATIGSSTELVNESPIMLVDQDGAEVEGAADRGAGVMVLTPEPLPAGHPPALLPIEAGGSTESLAADHQADHQASPISASEAPGAADLTGESGEFTNPEADGSIAATNGHQSPVDQGLRDVTGPAVAETRQPTMMRVAVEAVQTLSRDSGRSTALQERGLMSLQAALGALDELGRHLARAGTMINRLEVEASIRIQSARVGSSSRPDFDPMELDRYTSLQEVSRGLAECMADINLCGQGIGTTLRSFMGTEEERTSVANAIQERATSLLEVPVDSMAVRLDRVIDVACTDAGKQAHLLLNGEAAIPGPTLDRFAPCIEHIVRNAIAHGIEPPKDRATKGKQPAGKITVAASRTGARVTMTISDDGAGIDRAKVIDRARAKGLLPPHGHPSDQEVFACLFKPGFSTADRVSQLSGRGVGLDVVLSALNEIGGDVRITSTPGQGTTFTLSAPADISSMDVLPVIVGGMQFMIPTNLIDQITPLSLTPGTPDAATITLSGAAEGGPAIVCPITNMARLAGIAERSHGSRRYAQMATLIVMGMDTGAPMAFRVDEIRSQRKINATRLSPLVAHLPGMLASSIDADRNVVLVVNPLRMRDLGEREVNPEPARKLIMLVDDSATVRMSTSQALRREGFDVLLANDGLDAMEQLQAGARPDVFIFDLEMPRMDGFELTRLVRSKPEFQASRILVVSSRTNQKHRDMAMSLGVSAFLGKPAQASDIVALLAPSLTVNP